MSNIPSFNSVCGTVVESLAETIQNREKIIIQLREENARLERVAADAVRKATAWKNEVEACGGDEKKIRDLQEEVRNLSERNAALQSEIEDFADDGIGYDPHTEADAARAEEGKKRQEEYRKRHEERMARIAATRKNAEGKSNPPF
jgi:predicted  nucleic acid-binding Zn-ribbon protein